MKRLTFVAVAALLAGCAQAPDGPPSQLAAEAQFVEGAGATGIIHRGKAGGVDYSLDILMRLEPAEGGQAAICGIALLSAASDVTARVTDGLKHPDSLLTAKPPSAGGTGAELAVHPSFLKLVVLSPKSGYEPQKGNCIVTAQPWQEWMAAGPPRLALKLMMLDERQRSRKVIGGGR